MKSYIGPTLRQLRKSKNMTLQDVAHNIISYPFLSKVERGQGELSAYKLLNILDKLNVRVDEFDLMNNILSNSDNSQCSFINTLRTATTSDDLYWIHKLLDEQHEAYKQTNNPRHHHNSILLKQYINRLSELDYDTKDQKIISDYLGSVENWGYYELTLFNNSMFFMSADTLICLSNTAFKKADFFSKLNNHRHLLATVIINIIETLIESNKIEEIPLFIHKGEEQLVGTSHYYELNKLYYFKGLYSIRQGQKEGHALAKQSIQLMRRMGQHNKATKLENKLKTISSQYIL